MGRPKLKKEEKKIKVSITLDNEMYEFLSKVTSNKSKFIEELIKKIPI
jgi:hypothetical protein